MSHTSDKARRLVFLGSQAEPCLIHEEVPIPMLKPGEILGKLRMATICGSDLHTISGKRKEPTPRPVFLSDDSIRKKFSEQMHTAQSTLYSGSLDTHAMSLNYSILGHEGVVEVINHLRPDANIKKGDRITFHVINCCKKCVNCREGLQQKCSSLFKYGHSIMTEESQLNGCYASHIIIHSGTHVAKIPDQVKDNVAATVNCALATMVNVVSGLTGKSPYHDTVALVQGCGLLGIYGCVLLHEAGFSKVYCSDIEPKRLKMVQKFGGIPVIAGGSPPSDLGEGSVDVVIEVCGFPGVIPDGIRLLRTGGLYVLAGMVHPNSNLDITGEQIIRKCITIKGIHNYGSQHLDEAVSFLSRTCDKYPYDELFSPSFKLMDFEQALQLSKEQAFNRVCVEP